MRLGTVHLANQRCAGRDVPPLIAAAQLQRDPVTPVQLREVVRLQQHVRELGVADARLTADARIDGVLLQHVVHREVLSDVTQKADQVQRPQPVGVVPHHGAVRATKVQHARQLVADARDVFLHELGREQLPFRRLAARITDHSCAAANQRHRTVTGTLQMHQRHDLDKVARVQTRGGRVETDISRDRAARECGRGTVGVLKEQAAPRELVEKGCSGHGHKVNVTIALAALRTDRYLS